MQTLNQNIKDKSFFHVYLLYGTERYLINQYSKRLRDALAEGDTFNVHSYYGKDFSQGQVIDMAETMPFLGDKKVLLIKDSELFCSSGGQLADYISEISPTAYIIFSESKVDKKTKLYKAVQKAGHVVEFKPMDDKTLKLWILSLVKKEKKQITENALSLFLDRTGSDMTLIEQELEKLFAYTSQNDSITEADVAEITTNSIRTKVFDMVNALGAGQRERALGLYYDLLANKEAPMSIIFNITRQVQQLFFVKSLLQKRYSTSQIAEQLGLPTYIASKIIGSASQFSLSQLKAAVEACLTAEEQLKTGSLPSGISLEILLLTIFS